MSMPAPITMNGQEHSTTAMPAFTGGSARRSPGVTVPHSGHGAPKATPASECPHSSQRIGAG
jgi:hypothetical protein